VEVVSSYAAILGASWVISTGRWSALCVDQMKIAARRYGSHACHFTTMLAKTRWYDCLYIPDFIFLFFNSGKYGLFLFH
jgi:hypothetical protein